MVAILLLLVVAGAALAIVFGRRDGVVRYEVRLDIVGVDGVSRHGTSVWETRVSPNRFARTYRSTLRGEAVIVSDGGEGVYAGLLRAASSNGALWSDQTVMIPESLFGAATRALLPESKIANRVAIIETIARHPDWSTTMSYEEGLAKKLPLPFIVHLPDPASPASLTSATPGSASTNPVPKISATISISNKQVTTGIRDHLPWVRKKNPDNKMLDGKRYDISMRSGLANRLGTGDFSTEAM